jgi:hypothetical protein
MDALIITAPGTIASPEAYLPDIETGLYYQVKANDFSLPNGQLTNPIVTSRGSASLGERTFECNTGNGSGWILPTFANAGGPKNGKYFAWNGVNNRLQNINGGYNPLPARDQTFFWLFRNTKHPPANAPYLAGIVNAANDLIMWLDSAGAAFYGAGGTLHVTCASLQADDWTSVIVAQNSTRTRIKVGDADIVELPQGRMDYKGMVLGGRWANQADPPGTLNGGFAAWGMYTRMLSDSDMQGLYLDLAGT